MRNTFISIGSAALAMMMFSTSVQAAPFLPVEQIARSTDFIQVRDSQMGDRRDIHPGEDNGENVRVWRHRGGWDRGDRWDRGNRWDRGERYGWYNGHRGYRDYRPGYRRHGGFWFPGAAFVTGAIIGGAIASEPTYRAPRMSNSHIRYCMQKYRSYRVSDDTYQPNSGPRRRCM